MKKVAVTILLALGLVTTLSPAASAKTEPKFWVRCGMTVSDQAIDPIVSFGTKSAHKHVFFGAWVSPFDSNRTLRHQWQEPECSTPKDRSGYWMPSVRQETPYQGDAPGTMEIVLPTELLVYYRNANPGRRVVPFPQNLQIVTQAVVYSCGRGTAVAGSPYPCAPGTSPRAIAIVRPEPGQPNFPEVRMDFKWDDEEYRAGIDPSAWVWDSDVQGPRHADFMNAWNRRGLTHLINKCLNRGERCGKITEAD